MFISVFLARKYGPVWVVAPYSRLCRFYNGHAVEAISTIQLRGFETINEQLDYDDTVIFLPGKSLL